MNVVCSGYRGYRYQLAIVDSVHWYGHVMRGVVGGHCSLRLKVRG